MPKQQPYLWWLVTYVYSWINSLTIHVHYFYMMEFSTVSTPKRIILLTPFVLERPAGTGHLELSVKPVLC